VKSVHHSCFTV